MQSQKAGQ